MKRKKNIVKARVSWLFCFVLALVICPAWALADWQKMDPPPDVDKSAHHVAPLPPTCWLATAANMLAGAGYGNGATVQARADDIYNDLVAHYGTGSGGWTDTAITWWLSSDNNVWPGNPYDVVTVYGNKTKTPWAYSNGARFIGNELRRCQMLGLSISWPRTTPGGGPSGGHAITCWGDSSGKGYLFGNPSRVIVTDSDRDTGGDVQKYNYDNYVNPNPSGYDEGNGWYINYNSNHPFIKHIVTLCPTDNPGDHTLTQKVTGCYKIHQDRPLLRATDLHYKVGTDVDILSYKTTINWSTANKPVIVEDASPPRELDVVWDLKDNPVPYCTWITIDTEFVLPYWNAISYRDVYFTYPGIIGRPFPWFRWQLTTPELREPNLPSITGGYVIGAFDLIDPNDQNLTVVGEYRFQHEYDFMQDPEQHIFELQADPDQTYPFLAGNFRFGHSYGILDVNELYRFDKWMSRIPNQMPLSPTSPIKLTLNWDGMLPYPQGEDYVGQYPPPKCTEFLPQDFDKSCCVDFNDFAIFASAWLECTSCPNCPPEVPIYRTTTTGLTQQDVDLLAEAFGIPVDEIALENGAVHFIDSSGFQAVPTVPITDPNLIAQLLRDSGDDSNEQFSFDGLNFEAIRGIVVIDGKTAVENIRKTFDAITVTMQSGNPQPEASHTMFDAFDLSGQPIIQDAMLDTQVSYNFNLNEGGIPLIGPGAQVCVSYGPSGNVTQLLYSFRELEPGQSIPIITPQEAARRCARAYPGTSVQIKPQLVYFAPDLSHTNAEVVLPCYDCGGESVSPTGEQQTLLRRIIPATDDPQFTPTVKLNVQIAGNLVNAQATVVGGAGPYSFDWSSSTTELPEFPDDASSIEYDLAPRMPDVTSETVIVVVTDRNGVMAHASQTVMLPASVQIAAASSDVSILVGGVRDFGVERAVSDLGAENQSRYVNRMDNWAVKRFNWSGVSAWERDFKEGGTGLDYQYVDNVDECFYIGHGNGGGFTFESSQDDTKLAYGDAVKAWGDGDLEWLALLSCQVLRKEYGGKQWYQRWGPTFDGLHLLCGFQTNAHDWPNFGKRFAQYQLGRHFLFHTVTLPVRCAWFRAKKEEQPNDNEAVVMGVFGPGGCSNYYDYFWGKGPTGPDIRGSNILGYWRVVYK